MTIRSIGAALVLLAAGCGGGSPAGGAAGGGPPAQAQGGAAAPAALWSRDALTVQPRLEELRLRTPAELGFEPGTTPWRPAEVGTSGTGGAGSPGALLHRMAIAAGVADPLGSEVWEVTTRVWSEGDDATEGVILVWGLQDDAVAGRDLRVAMRRGAEGWAVVRVEERFHCARGVTAEGICS